MEKSGLATSGLRRIERFWYTCMPISLPLKKLSKHQQEGTEINCQQSQTFNEIVMLGW
jgi:hypothetical protein